MVRLKCNERYTHIGGKDKHAILTSGAKAFVLMNISLDLMTQQ